MKKEPFFEPVSEIWKRLISRYGKEDTCDKIYLIGGTRERTKVSIPDTDTEDTCNYSLELGTYGCTLFKRTRKFGTMQMRLTSIAPFLLEEEEKKYVRKLFINKLRNYERMLKRKSEE